MSNHRLNGKLKNELDHKKTLINLIVFSAALGRVCLKLVVVMGITWITDVISWTHENFFDGKHSVWIFIDLINALHGVFIFMVVGCQPQVRRHSFSYCLFLIEMKKTRISYFHSQVSAAIKRLWSSKTGRFTTNTTHGAQNSSSSQGMPSIGDSAISNNTYCRTTSSKVPLETIC